MDNNLSEAFDQVVEEIFNSTLSFALDTWVREAQAGLKSSREEYLRGIDGVKKDGPFSGYIELKGKFPVMIEEGFSSYDIKHGHQTSPKAKRTMNGGWYTTVPFRHRVNSPVNSNMPSNVFNRAKNLNHGESLSAALVESLGHKKEVSHTGYQWKNTMYDNLTRIVKGYDPGKNSSQHITYRRISDKSDPKSWIHPGYEGLKALDKVVPATEKFFYDSFNGD